MKQKVSKYIAGYQGSIRVPKTLKIGKSYSVQELAMGNVFRADVYDGLSRKTQLKIAKEFAEFLILQNNKVINIKCFLLKI